MEPIPETIEAVNELDPLVDVESLMAELVGLGNRAKRIVPDLVGVSIARLDQGVTFTLVATADEIAVLDAVQYVAGGPCVDAAVHDDVREFDGDDAFDEERWRLFSEATAWHAVRSTLTLPVMGGRGVLGTVNLYAASRNAFAGLREDLAEVFGAWASGAVANADLSFTTRSEARTAPQRIRDQNVVAVATGIVAAQLGVDVEAAQARLHDAAARGGVSVAHLARDIVRAREGRDRGGRS
jgi:GAF domain-containing protein